ncbi:MAG: cation-transporting P-type ATPase [Chromatiaceae bacterium]
MNEQSAAAWHHLPGDEAMQRLAVGNDGLSAAEAQQRLERYGVNRLTPPKPRSALVRFLSQFDNLLIYILLAAGVVTVLLGHFVDAGVIFGVVLINSIIGFIQEGKAEKALEAVRNLLSLKATVIRDGHRHTVPAEEVVPGDLVFLQSGDRVPADLRLVTIRELRVDEAILTGESMPSSKRVDPVREEAPLGDRRNMAYSGTLVTYGQATGAVTATGDSTEIGRISAMLAEVQTMETPLTRQMARFARGLTAAILALAVFTAVFGILVHDYPLSEMFLAGVGLAVAAIPEGLPAIITITLAIGVQRMAARNAIIRRLPAVETLGSVTVICSDKTGTLTRNEMTVQAVATRHRLYSVSGVGYDPHGGFSSDGRDEAPGDHPVLQELCLASVLCNDARLVAHDGQWRVEGDPMEGALLVLGRKAGLDPELVVEELPRDDIIPFESEHRFMATLHHDHTGQRTIYIKGAPEVVFSRCSHQRTETGDTPFERDYWLAEVEEIGRRGQRALAIAVHAARPDQEALRFDDVAGELVMLGLVGIIDPPRNEAIEAVAHCRSAGIGVKMITGDHATTATAIATQMGIGDGRHVLTGADLDRLDDAALEACALDVDVFARASPEHKLRLVRALQARDQVVSMTGDGVNDAPALKRAGVGVAMGLKGTEAAKEAAEMVLADDNFASITHAVREGRTVYDNIKKSILFILPTNGGEALTILAAVAMGRMLPVTAAQILWVNMITAVTLALSLAFEAGEADLMRRRPRPPSEPLLTGFMTWRIIFVSVLMVTGTFGLFLWERAQGTGLEEARTVAVNALVIAEAFYLLNARFLTASVLNRNGLLGNRYVLIAIVLVVGFQMLFTYLPLMQTFFGTAAIDAAAWARILVFGLALFMLVELEKALLRWRDGRKGLL